jgi:Undecaprenyl-phosphate glucose phosphotransferase
MQIDSGPRASAGTAKKRFSISSHVIPGLIVTLDSVVILASGAITYFVLVGYFGDTGYYATAIAFVWITTILLMNFAGLYEFDAVMRPLAFADKIIIAFATTFFFLLASAFALKVSAEYSRIWTVSFAASTWIATMLLRVFAALVIGRLADRQIFSRNVIIIGSGQQADKLLAHLKRSQPRFISLLGIIVEKPEDLATNDRQHNVLGTIDSLPSYIRSNVVDDVIICLPWAADDRIASMMDMLRELPVNVYLGADLIGFRLPIRAAPDHFGTIPLVEVMGRPLAGWGGIQKAALDYGLGVILTVLLLPLMIVVIIAIRLESKGPALFLQPRYGFVNKVFNIYKFRTMRHSTSPENKIVQATRHDPRVTLLGRVLRRTSLDELPQLFNVLNGTMSLVGPRPHAVQHNEEYARVIRGYFARHRVKPGMTGWAQVNGCRGETKNLEDMEARVKYDIYYAENWSLLFDLKILVMTAIICLTGRNAY